MDSASVIFPGKSFKRATYLANLGAQKVRDDVARIKKHARAVIVIDETGLVLSEMMNKDYWLNVIAIVGPATIFGEFFQEAVLFEMGISETKPYRKNKSLRNGSKSIAERLRVPGLSIDQFRSVLPRIEEVMFRISVESIQKRKWFGQTWRLLGVGRPSEEYRHYLSFIVSVSDEFIRRSLFVADNAFRVKSHQKFATSVSFYLRGFKSSNPSVRRLCKSKKARAVRNGFEEYQRALHHLAQILRMIPDTRQTLLFFILGEWRLTEKVPHVGEIERVVAKSIIDPFLVQEAANVLELPHGKFSLGDVFLPQGFDRGEYLLFQYYPKRFSP